MIVKKLSNDGYFNLVQAMNLRNGSLPSSLRESDIGLAVKDYVDANIVVTNNLADVLSCGLVYHDFEETATVDLGNPFLPFGYELVIQIMNTMFPMGIVLYNQGSNNQDNQLSELTDAVGVFYGVRFVPETAKKYGLCATADDDNTDDILLLKF